MTCAAMLLSSGGRVGHAETGGNGRPLVFIHGIEGATLVDPQGQTHWLTPWQVLNIGTLPLALPMQWHGDVQASDDLKAVEILSGLRWIPYLFETAIYGPWLRAARSWPRPFYTFVYDWRRDPNENAALFETFLEKVQSEHGGQRPEVVAHSLGGLITLAVVNKRPELFQRIFFVGTPFAGGLGFLPDLVEGEATGLNRQLLAPSVVGTFPSYYTFLPLDGAGIVDRAGKNAPIDFYSAAEWKKRGWGIFRDKHGMEEKEKFLTQALARARAFRERLVAVPGVTYPPAVVIASREHSTLAEVLDTGRKGRRFDFTARPGQPGDGRVLEKSAVPPKGIPFELFFSENDHAALLNDPKVMAVISGAVPTTRDLATSIPQTGAEKSRSGP